jgi:tRNA-uridine 2-sulfurtransferase
MTGNKNFKSKGKVALGLSGGVDSSVAGLMLKAQGYDVTGVYIKCWDVKEDGCAADEDKAYAVQTAIKLGIKFETLDFRKEYQKKVIDYFYNEYSKGRTPNPDVMCNKEIKFGIFYDWAVKNGFYYVSTGHYARVIKTGDEFQLLKGKDPSKDQSYFLYLLDQKHLSNVLFPLGDLKKTQVRKMAKENKLPSAARPDSMGICFIGEVNIKEFLEKRIKHVPGKVLDTKGNMIGKHDGVWFFTIGQRHGFKLDKYSASPMYVIDKNPDRNELIVGKEKDTYRKSFKVGDVHWIGNKNFLNKKESFDCEVRIRHLGKMFKAKVKKNSGTFEINLEKPVFGVAPGQSCVFYQGDVVLGGGIIQ